MVRSDYVAAGTLQVRGRVATGPTFALERSSRATAISRCGRSSRMCGRPATFLAPLDGVTKFSCAFNHLSISDLAEIASGRAVSMVTALGGGMHSLKTLVRTLVSSMRARSLLVAAVLVLRGGDVAVAQGYETMQPMATRADLTAMADRMGRGSESDRARAADLRTRLREGDFHAGDRV